MELQNTDAQLPDECLRDILLFTNAVLIQQCNGRTAVAFRSFGFVRQVVHFRTACIGLCLRIRHLVGLFDGRGIVCFCFVVLFQTLISFCTAHVGFDVGRVHFDHFGKSCYRFGIIQFGQILLAKLDFFSRISCPCRAGRQKHRNCQKKHRKPRQPLSFPVFHSFLLSLISCKKMI